MFVEDIHAKQKSMMHLNDVNLEDFGFDVFGDQFREDAYTNTLYEAAYKMIDNAQEYTDRLKEYGCEFDEVMDGKSPIHPFLEIGGAIRIQVPLPKTMGDLKTLLKLVLQKYDCKEKDDFLEGGFNKFSPLDSLNIDIGNNAKLFIWNDACRMHDIKKVSQENRDWMEFNQSLLIVLCSVIYQQSDLDAYGKRGRYGAETVRRLIDGHAGQPTELSPANKTITTFIFDGRDGKPFGVYSGVVFPKDFNIQLENGAWKYCELPAPSVQLNYTFIQTSPAGVIDRGREVANTNPNAPRFTDFIVAGLLARTSQLMGCDIDSIFVTIHTDKCAAAKSSEKYLEVLEENRNFYRAISRKVWTNIIHNRLTKFRSGMEASNWKSLFFADRSTVEKGDPAEEVPLGSDRFYRAVYPAYVKLVKNRTGKPLSIKLLNGGFNKGEVDKVLRLLGLGSERLLPLLEGCSFRSSTNQLVPLVIEGRLSDIWPMNSRHSWRQLNIDWEGYGVVEEKHKIEIGKLLNRLAKKGNSSNSDNSASFAPNVDLDVPRLTEFGFILAGNLKIKDDNNQLTRIGNAISWIKETYSRSRL